MVEKMAALKAAMMVVQKDDWTVALMVVMTVGKMAALMVEMMVVMTAALMAAMLDLQVVWYWAQNLMEHVEVEVPIHNYLVEKPPAQRSDALVMVALKAALKVE